MKTKAKLEAEKQELDKRLYDETWQGKYWGKNGVLHKSWRMLWLNFRLGDGIPALIGLASTFYSAAGNAMSQDQRKFIWYVRARWYGLLALLLSKLFLTLARLTHHRMVWSDLDVYVSIHKRAGLYKSASRWMKKLRKAYLIPTESLPIVLVNAADLSSRMGNNLAAWDDFKFAMDFAEHHNLRRRAPTTVVRVYKAFGNYLIQQDWRDDALDILQTGRGIASDANLDDQVIKIDALIAQC